jgi:hypothetical protein
MMRPRPLVLLFALVARAVAQEAPNKIYQTNQFNTSQEFRQDFCERYRSVADGELELSSALKGVAIRSVLVLSEFNNIVDGKIDEDYPGLECVLLDELCKRAGCTWRDTYAITGPDPIEGKTWTEVLTWTVRRNSFDGCVVDSLLFRLVVAHCSPMFTSRHTDRYLRCFNRLVGQEYRSLTRRNCFP